MSQANLQAEADAIIKEAWQAYADSGDPADAAIARKIAKVAAQPASCAKKRPKAKLSRAARKRKAFKRSVQLNSDAPILAQVRCLD